MIPEVETVAVTVHKEKCMYSQQASLEERLRYIDYFFDNLSVEEFEQMAIESGAGYIKKSSESDYVKAMKPIIYD